MNPPAIRHIFEIPVFEDVTAATIARRLYFTTLAGLALTIISYGVDVASTARLPTPSLLLAILVVLISGAVLFCIRHEHVNAAQQIFLAGCWGIVVAALLATKAFPDWFAPTTNLLFVTLGIFIGGHLPAPILPAADNAFGKALRESEKRYRVISELISAYAYAYDVNTDGSITPGWITEDSFTRLTGYSWQEIGSTFRLYHPEDAPRAQADVQRTLQGEAVTGEYRIITRSGQLRRIYMRRRPEWSADGQRVVRFYGAAQDVTDKREAEEALRVSESRYRILTANLPESVVILYDQDMRFVLVDGPEVERTGYSKAQMEGKTVYEALPPDFVQMVEPNMRATLDGQTFSAELPFGDAMYAYNYIPLRDANDKISLGMILGENVTQRMRVETALRQAEAVNRAFSENLKILFAIMLELSKCETLDDLCRKAVELGHTQLQFDRLGLWIVTEDRQSMVGTFGIDEHGNLRDERCRRASIAPIRYVFSDIAREGARVYFQADRELYNDRDEIVGRGWIGVGTLLDGEQPIGTLSADNLLSGRPLEPCQLELLALYTSYLSNLITRKRTEIALRESEEKFRSIFDLSPYGITIQQKGGVFIDANQAFLSAFGYSREDVQGKTILEMNLMNDETSIENLMHKLARTGRMLNEEVTLYRTDGQPLTMLLSSQYLQLAGRTHVLTVGVDITERIQVEQKVLQLNSSLEQRVEQRTQQLQVTNKELEAFAYSVSHDLRAPLRSIDGFSQALLEDYEPLLDETSQGYLNRIRAAAQRMGSMIDALLTLSRITRAELNRQSVNLSQLAAEIVATLQAGEPERAVEVIIAPEVYGQGDIHLLHIALQNLLQNAWKYTLQQPQPRIEFGSRDQQGNAVYFVADNGIGFDMAFADKLFVAFQRLHIDSEFPGNGIGLATVQRVIHRHGGRIWAEAQPSQGAVFYFTLMSGTL